MDTIIAILNYQPFGDHGVMSIASIRVIHILLLWVVWKISPSWKEIWKNF